MLLAVVDEENRLQLWDSTADGLVEVAAIALHGKPGIDDLARMVGTIADMAGYTSNGDKKRGRAPGSTNKAPAEAQKKPAKKAKPGRLKLAGLTALEGLGSKPVAVEAWAEATGLLMGGPVNTGSLRNYVSEGLAASIPDPSNANRSLYVISKAGKDWLKAQG